MKPGDVITGESGRRWVVGELLAEQGREGCHDVRCTRNMLTGECVGWHCPRCGSPCNSQGHHECTAGEA